MRGLTVNTVCPVEDPGVLDGPSEQRGRTIRTAQGGAFVAGAAVGEAEEAGGPDLAAVAGRGGPVPHPAKHAQAIPAARVDGAGAGADVGAVWGCGIVGGGLGFAWIGACEVGVAGRADGGGGG